MQKVFNVAVDIGRKLPAPAFDVNTNDLKSVKLLITITNGQTLLDLTDTTVRIAIRKPDNNIIFQDCTIKDAKAGQVEIVLENQAYIMPGTHTAEIMCYKGSDVVAVSGTFSYKSTKGIMNDEAVESRSEFTVINQKIEEARKLLEDAAESGVGVDEQARQDIQEVTAQLADTTNTTKDRLNTGLYKKTNRRPLISFMDDDGNILVYTLLYPLCKELKFKLGSCLITGTVGKSPNQVTEAQVKEMHDSGLIEFTSHTNGHEYLTRITETQRYETLKKSKDWLRARGYADDILVYPYGDTNEAVRQTAQKLYRAAINIDNTNHLINYPPLKSYTLERVYVDYGIDIAKQKIDEAIANNGWIIFGMHCHYPDFDINVVRQIVEYAREKSVDIVSITEGLNAFGNIMEIGDSASLGKPNTVVIDADGQSHGADSPHYVYRNGFTNSSLPSEFPIDKTTITTIGTSNTAGFPNGTGGVLLTHIYSTQTSFPWTYQEWFPIATNRTLTRYWDRATNAWSAWKEQASKYNTSGTNTYTNASLITEFPAGEVTVTLINSTGSTGFPENKAGTLTTYRINDAWGRQEYKLYQNGGLYQRYVNGSGSWSSWELISVIEYLGVNGATVSTLFTDNIFPSGKISYMQIGSAANTGFPVEYGGMLITNKLYASSGYQQFIPGAQQTTIYTRRWSGGAWTEWLRVGGGTGTTAQRPTGAYVGYMYFDTTLGKPIWLKTTPSTWVDSTGATV